jgi:pyruvyltransferase
VKPIKVFYYREEKLHHGNFGDELNRDVIRRFLGREIVYAPPYRAGLFAIGSILQTLRQKTLKRRLLRMTRPLHVWGSGLLRPTEGVDWRNVTVHAARGKLSLAQVPEERLAPRAALGDPGLLSNELINGAPQEKTRRIGLIPHFLHHGACVERFGPSVSPGEFEIISVDQPPVEVIRQIASCEFVYSTSLHGLIVADSVGVPNQWAVLNGPPSGAGFKFLDYYSVFDLAPAPFGVENRSAAELASNAVSLTSDYERPGLDAIRRDLLRAFPVAAIAPGLPDAAGQ